MTESEELFEDIFRERGIFFQRIPESAGQTPDYEVLDCDTRSYWEIKELVENEDEKSILNALENEEHDVYSVNSRRVENSIRSASAQFKSHGVTESPCIVVLFDARNFAVADFLLYQYVQNAMLGTREYMEQTDGSFKVVKRNAGILTSRKRYVSAVGIMLRETREIIFFHNPHASSPILGGIFSTKFSHHYCAHESEYRLEWKPAQQTVKE